jgi:hypothetical protein
MSSGKRDASFTLSCVIVGNALSPVLESTSFCVLRAFRSCQQSWRAFAVCLLPIALSLFATARYYPLQRRPSD